MMHINEPDDYEPDDDEDPPRPCPQCGGNNVANGKCQACGYHDGMLSMPGGDKL